MFVKRTGKKITAVFRCAQPGIAEEELEDDHKEIVAFESSTDLVVSKAMAREKIIKAAVEALCAESFKKISECKTAKEADAMAAKFSNA